MVHATAMRSGLLLSIVLVACSAPAPEPVTPSPTSAPPPATQTAAAVSKPPPPKADASLPAREAFFGNPDRAAPKIAPDGKYLAFLAPDEGVLNVWVGPVDDPAKAKPVTKDRKRGIRQYYWTHTGKHLVYMQDEGGTEDFHAYSVDVTNNTVKDLTPIDKVRANVLALSHEVPGKILVGLNDRDPKHHDVYEIELATAKRKKVLQNDEGYDYTADEKLRIGAASKVMPDASVEISTIDAKGAAKLLLKVGTEDNLSTSPIGFDKTGKTMFMLDSRGRDKAALVTIDTARGPEAKVVHEPAKADISDVLLHPKERTVQAVASTHARKEWTVLDEKLKADFAELAKVDRGDMQVPSRTLDDQRWIVAFTRDDGPLRYHLWDRKAKKATFLFSSKADLEKLPLVRMHPAVIPARDGLPLVSYVTLPKAVDPDGDGKPDRPSPLVLLVHGGPWGRDLWGYNSTHQWLASRGYAVMSVNFRGSTGFGKRFVNAADKEWAAKMHDDLIDAVQWAGKSGIADPAKVAIYGGSYGGYSALVGVTFTPKTFACAVDIVGPSNLVTLLQNVPPYWAPFLPVLTSKVGDPKTEEGRKFLLSRSPLSFVDKIERPLLIGQGANDPRVKQAESDQIVKAMQAKGIPVTYVLYPDEGHGFARPENRKSFNAVAEMFLASCLGGPYQPAGTDFKGASITVPAGVEHVHGLKDALSTK